MAVLDKLTKDFEGLPLPSEPIAESYKSYEELQQREVLTYMRVHVKVFGCVKENQQACCSIIH